MKNYIALVSFVFVGATAFAGGGGCDQSQRLICNSVSQMADGSSKLGAPVVGLVEDNSVEVFDPSDCEARVEMDSAAGKFIVDYNQNQTYLTGWVSADGKETSLFGSIQVSPNVPVQSADLAADAKSGVKSISFICRIDVSEPK